MRKWVWDRKGGRHERRRHAAPASPQSPLMLYRLLFISVIALLVIALAGLSSNSRDLVTFGHPTAASLSGGSGSDGGGCGSDSGSGSNHTSSLSDSDGDDDCPTPTPGQTPTGHIHIHKYTPKDNPSNGWKHEGPKDWTFVIDGTADYTVNNNDSTLVNVDDYTITETGLLAGYHLVDIYVPDHQDQAPPGGGNDQCEKDGPTGSNTSAQVMASYFADQGHNNSGTIHVCAFNAPTPTPTFPGTTPTPTPPEECDDNDGGDSCPSATPTPTATPVPTPTATIGPSPPPGTVDLSVSKTGSPNPVFPGSNLTYTITVSNAGPGTANGVVALDSLPGGVTFLSSSASQGFCTFVACNLGSIAPGGSATITLTVKINANTSGSVTNTACASTTSTEPNLTNNCDTTTNIVPTPTPTPTPTPPHVTPTPPNVTPTPPNVTPTPPNVTPTPPPTPEVDLVVHKVGSPNPVVAGNNLIYFITVTNLGPSPADAVVTVDTLPAGVTFVSATPSQGSCSFVSCSLGSLAPGATATISIIVRVNAGTASNLTNTVCVSSTTPESNLDNNCDSTTTTVTTPTPTPTPPPGQTPTPTPAGPRADLSLIKVDTPDPVSAGRNLTYGIAVTNNGPDPAPNVVVNDALPPGVALISATPSQGTCDGITCHLGTLAPGDSAAIAIVVEVGSNADPAITNIACASSSIIDPNLANNCDDETTTVTPTVTPAALPATSTPKGPAGFPTSGGLFGDGSWGSWLLLAIGLALLTLGGGAFYLSRKRRMRLDL